MIPKKIHYCWFGNNPIPAELKKYMKSWKKYCPDYEIICWNETNFNIDCHPFVRSAYDAKAWAFVSDYARLKVIYENGGIYLDTDIELLKSLDSFLKHDFFIGIQQAGGRDYAYATTGLGYGASQYNNVVREMLEEYDSIDFKDDEKGNYACPILNSNVLRKYGYEPANEIKYYDGIVVYPSEYFDPFSTGAAEMLLTSNTVSIHHYSASWMGNKERIRRRITNIIGISNVARLKKVRDLLRK